MGILGRDSGKSRTGGLGYSGMGGSGGVEGRAAWGREASRGMPGGRGGEQRKKKLKGTPPQEAPAPAVLSAEQQAFAAEEDLQRKAVAKRRRYMARRGL